MMEHPTKPMILDIIKIVVSSMMSSTCSGATPIGSVVCAPDKKMEASSTKGTDPKVLAVQVRAPGLESM
jgi:hypothetical protein